MKVSAYTSAVLACRKLLMNIAVAEGAKENRKFIEYVEFLANKGYVPPGGKHWVDHIRQQGNEATHEIEMKSESEAKDLISFVEMLLKFIYEFPARVHLRLRLNERDTVKLQAATCLPAGTKCSRVASCFRAKGMPSSASLTTSA